MKNNMEEIDQLIKETLTNEEARFYDELEEQNLLEMVGGLFKTKLRWIMILMNIVQVIAFGLFVYCLVMFFTTNVTNELIKWASGGFLFLLMSSMIKLFSWLQIDKNALLREMKRLELQVSSLSGKMSK
ncbi:MAG: hypothetical protein K0U54_04125 [Bacteroidetes bacterium]|nr:hypothetical protein [Bacteroidota bacterium]